MRLQISNNTPGNLGVFETHEGTHVNLNGGDARRITLTEVDPFNGVSLQVSRAHHQQSLPFSNNENSIFVPCKFDSLRLEGHSNKIRLSGINTDLYSISVDGCNNLVVFTDDTNVKCVDWREHGDGNTLDVSQQESTHTRGTFSPTTNVITKLPILPSCKICYGEERANVLMLPCGHLGMCHSCLEKLPSSTNGQTTCPFCRKPCTPRLLYLA